MANRHFREHSYNNPDIAQLSIAYSTKRIWININGQSVLRAKSMPDGTLAIDTPPSELPAAPSQANKEPLQLAQADAPIHTLCPTCGYIGGHSRTCPEPLA